MGKVAESFLDEVVDPAAQRVEDELSKRIHYQNKYEVMVYMTKYLQEIVATYPDLENIPKWRVQSVLDVMLKESRRGLKDGT